MEPVVVFDHVWKKFRRGERHDSLRDLLPAMTKKMFRRSHPEDLESAQEFWALKDVSFAVRPGEALGIIGPNGAGKSTTLKLLTRILRPTRGHCSVKGRVGALIEVAAGFHPDLTGRENIFLQGAIMGMKRAEIAGRLDEIIDFAGVEAFIDTPVKRYSSGMNARLGFSIAAHLNPEVLIIDEVLSVGDAAFQRRCVTRMSEFRERGAAIVFVSHDLQAIGNLCSVALRLGRDMPVVGPTATVVGDYLRESGDAIKAKSSSPVTFVRSELIGAGANGDESVAPSTPLKILLDVEISRPVPELTLGLILYRSTDNFVVYEGNLTSESIGFESGTPGRHSLVMHFDANLVRGHYHVECYALHTPTHEYLARISPAAMFIIDDPLTCRGVADIRLRASVPSAVSV